LELYKSPDGMIMKEHSTKKVLITGAHGYLGRYTALCFKHRGYSVYGIGHGSWAQQEYTSYGLDGWLDSDVNLESILSINIVFDIIVHCVGTGSVAYSLANPKQDFHKTVASTTAVLEFIRLTNPDCRFVYPSSAAVYGSQPDAVISEDTLLNPVSPYGYYKVMVENLCKIYSNFFSLDTRVIRFFSIYGNGLKKQLLWDVCNKLVTCKGERVEFFGAGNETRDFIHVSDASNLIYTVAEVNKTDKSVLTINGANGNRITVREVIELLRDEIAPHVNIVFNGQNRPGDPQFYHAQVQYARHLGWAPEVSLLDGLRDYVQWFRSIECKY